MDRWVARETEKVRNDQVLGNDVTQVTDLTQFKVTNHYTKKILSKKVKCSSASDSKSFWIKNQIKDN